MAVTFKTTKPKSPLKNFITRIEQKEAEGKITTWDMDNDGDFTHKASDWRAKAWFKSVVGTDTLTFNIIKRKDADMSRIVYAYYHGHLVETFLNHFDDQFSEASASALCTSGDVCWSS